MRLNSYNLTPKRLAVSEYPARLTCIFRFATYLSMVPLRLFLEDIPPPFTTNPDRPSIYQQILISDSTVYASACIEFTAADKD